MGGKSRKRVQGGLRNFSRGRGIIGLSFIAFLLIRFLKFFLEGSCFIFPYPQFPPCASMGKNLNCKCLKSRWVDNPLKVFVDKQPPFLSKLSMLPFYLKIDENPFCVGSNRAIQWSFLLTKKITETAKSLKKTQPIAGEYKKMEEIAFVLIFEMLRSDAINLQLDKRLMFAPKLVTHWFLSPRHYQIIDLLKILFHFFVELSDTYNNKGFCYFWFQMGCFWNLKTFSFLLVKLRSHKI